MICTPWSNPSRIGSGGPACGSTGGSTFVAVSYAHEEKTCRRECGRHPEAVSDDEEDPEGGATESNRGEQDDERGGTRHEPAGDPHTDQRSPGHEPWGRRGWGDGGLFGHDQRRVRCRCWRFGHRYRFSIGAAGDHRSRCAGVSVAVTRRAVIVVIVPMVIVAVGVTARPVAVRVAAGSVVMLHMIIVAVRVAAGPVVMLHMTIGAVRVTARPMIIPHVIIVAVRVAARPVVVVSAVERGGPVACRTDEE